jgi:hypothetical protein
MRAPRQKLDIDRTRERLVELGCLHAAEQLDTLLVEAVRRPIPAHEFLEALLAAEASGRGSRRVKTARLVIDELGFEPMSRREASLFFRLVTYRYRRSSILITTNKRVREWTELLAGDEVLAPAILDRLLHKAHVLNIRGPQLPAARPRAVASNAATMTRTPEPWWV